MATLSVAADITAYLADAGLGTLGVDLFTDDMPADPDDLVVLYEYPGMESIWTRGTIFPALERPRLQLNVRGTSYPAVAAKTDAIHTELLGVANLIINGVQYGHIRHLQDGWLKTRDERGRHLWQRNYQVIREVVIST